MVHLVLEAGYSLPWGNKESVDFVHKELQCLQITGNGERSKAEHLSIFSQPIFLVSGWTQKKRKGKTNSKGLEWLCFNQTPKTLVKFIEDY